MRTALAFILVLLMAGVANAASTGLTDCTVSPGAGTSEAPWSDDAWEDADASSCGDDGAPNDVSSNSFDAGDQTYVLYHSGFGYAIDGTIDGVRVVLNTYHSNANADIDLCQLLDATGTRGGTNLCSGLVAINSAATTNTVSIGGATETWGNSLTDTIINDADFGIAIGIVNNNNNGNVFIDYVQMDVFYTTGGVVGRRRMIFQ